MGDSVFRRQGILTHGITWMNIENTAVNMPAWPRVPVLDLIPMAADTCSPTHYALTLWLCKW